MKFLKKDTGPGIKNLLMSHDFKKVRGSGYDPEQDGDDPQWGRIDVHCADCGENRRIGVSIGRVNSLGGCVRSWDGKTFVIGDELSAPTPVRTMSNRQVVYFKQYMQDGKLAVSSAGNLGEYIVNPEDIKPLLGK